MRRFSLCLALSLLIASFAFYFSQLTTQAVQPRNTAINSLNKPLPTSHRAVLEAFGRLPLRFEASAENLAKFVARSAAYSVSVSAVETLLRLRDSGKTKVLRMQLDGALMPKQLHAFDQLPGKSHYFTGAEESGWRTEVSGYGQIEAAEVYPGINLLWHGNGQQLEYDFVLNPGARAERIRMRWLGAKSIKLNAHGDILLEIGTTNPIRLLKPQAWQDIQGQRRAVACEYHLLDSRQIAFKLGAYDRRWPLVIDPVVSYTTLVGGTGFDTINAIAVDAEGNTYLTGTTDSADFPGSNPIQTDRGQQSDAFVLKLNATGSAMIFGAWLGGAQVDGGNSIAVDNNNNVYVAGRTNSVNFPLKNSLHQTRGNDDGFLAKLNATGNQLLYSTIIGGSGADNISGMALDNNNNVYVTGSTDSDDFPTLNALQPNKKVKPVYFTANGASTWENNLSGLAVGQVYSFAFDARTTNTLYAATDRGFFKTTDSGSTWTKLAENPGIQWKMTFDPTPQPRFYGLAGNTLLRSTNDGATWQAIQNVGDFDLAPSTNASAPATIYAAVRSQLPSLVGKSVDGGTNWTYSNLPSTPGQSYDIAILKVNSAQPNTVYAFYPNRITRTTDGGTSWSIINSTFEAAGNGQVAMSLSSANTLYYLNRNFNTKQLLRSTDGGIAWQAVPMPMPDQVYTPMTLAIDPTNANILYLAIQSTNAAINGIYKSSNGGTTWTFAHNSLGNLNVNALAISPNQPSRVYAGPANARDAFLSKLNAAGTALVYSTYFGGNQTDDAADVAVDAAGNAYLCGTTSSVNLPVLSAYQSTNKGSQDGFIAKFSTTGNSLVYASYIGGSSDDGFNAITLNPAGNAFVTGFSRSLDFPLFNAAQAVNRSVPTPGVMFPPPPTDAVITRLGVNGAMLDYSTYLGGASNDETRDIVVDANNNAYVIGTTNSVDFPLNNSLQPYLDVTGYLPFSGDAFITQLSADGKAFRFSSFFGGRSADSGRGMALDAKGDLYLTGNTISSDLPVSGTVGNNGLSGGAAFIAKLTRQSDLSLTISDAPDPVMISQTLFYYLKVTNAGPDAARDVTITDTLPAGVAFVSATVPGGSCTYQNTVTCRLPELAANSQAEAIITVTPSGTGTLSNRATVISATPDNNNNNNSATVETRVGIVPGLFGRILGADGNGINNVAVTLSGTGNAIVSTNSEGFYQFASLANGASYAVTPTKEDYVFNPASRSFNNLTKDQRGDFTATACVFSLSKTSQSFAALGGNGSVTLTSPDARCPWNARSNVPWIKIISASNGSGNATINFTVEPTAMPRTAELLIGKQKLRVWQEFYACDKFQFPPAVPSFPIAETSSIQEFPPRVVAGDFNGDLRPDLLYRIDATSDGLWLALGTADGKFASPVAFMPNTRFREFRVTDFNRDGKTDFAGITLPTVSGQRATIVVMLGDSLNGLSAPVIYSPEAEPITLNVADLNQDTKPDLVVGGGGINQSGPVPTQYTIGLMAGDGTGKLAQPVYLSLETSPGNFPTQIAPGDFNGDGKMEFATKSLFGQPVVWINQGQNNFTPTTINFNSGNVQTFVAADFNQDGRSDLALLNNGITILLSDPAASAGFQALPNIPVLGVSKQIAVADFNADGFSDVAVTVGTGIALCFGRGKGLLAAPIYHTAGNVYSINSTAVIPLETLDLNGDARPELLLPVRISTGWQIAFLTATSEGFNAPRSYPTILAVETSFPVTTLGDLNGDGALDFILADSFSETLHGTVSDGYGGYYAPKSLPLRGRPSRPVVRDFNQDGKGDVAVYLESFKTIAILLGDGTGGFTRKTELAAAESVYTIVAGDFNNDGKFDLIARSTQPGLTLFAGDGTGNFTALTNNGLNFDPLNVLFQTADFNGDGNLDLLVYPSTLDCVFSPQNFRILPGDGQGNFKAAIPLRLPAAVSSIYIADFDQDGVSDLLCKRACFGNLESQFMLKGNTTFQFKPAGEVDLPATAPIFADLTKDGKPDLISYNGNELRVLAGNGDGTYRQPFTLRPESPLNLIAIHDQNADGLPDL